MTNQGPLYMQIKNYILEEINNGKFKPGDKLPSEKDFTDLFEVSRVTVRSALAELQSEGVISRISGRGTFVSEDLKLDYTDSKAANSKASPLIGVILCHLDSPFHIHLL
ncbi:MAG: GntR family transcriptional regulator, partial [Epulopiscium sp.]|nr:GntR family transcriptional regulator [Candidatus Epulonipiscium sp.]